MAVIMIEQDRRWSTRTPAQVSVSNQDPRIELIREQPTPTAERIVRIVGSSASIASSQISTTNALNPKILHRNIENILEVTVNNSVTTSWSRAKPFATQMKEDDEVNKKFAVSLATKYCVLSVVGLVLALISLLAIYVYPVFDPGIARISLPFSGALLSMVALDYFLNGRSNDVRC